MNESTLNISDTVKTADLGTIQRTGGTVKLTGDGTIRELNGGRVLINP